MKSVNEDLCFMVLLGWDDGVSPFPTLLSQCALTYNDIGNIIDSEMDIMLNIKKNSNPYEFRYFPFDANYGSETKDVHFMWEEGLSCEELHDYLLED